jgi:hypothetical protein
VRVVDAVRDGPASNPRRQDHRVLRHNPPSTRHTRTLFGWRYGGRRRFAIFLLWGAILVLSQDVVQTGLYSGHGLGEK